MVRREDSLPPRALQDPDGRPRRSAFPQRPRRLRDRDRRTRIHVHRRDPALRPPACILRHGRRQRVHLLLLLDAVSLQSQAPWLSSHSGRMRLEGRSPGLVAAALTALGSDMARSRSVIIAGAGIGGLTAALAIARAGYRVVVLEQAARLEEAGAGIQLSPNATAVLAGLGLTDRLRPSAVAPEAIEIRTASGRPIQRIPLGATAEQRYGAPYWVIHRADLQAALVAAIKESPDITLKPGTRAEDFALHQHGLTVQTRAKYALD